MHVCCDGGGISAMVQKVADAREPWRLPPAPAALLALAPQTPRGARDHTGNTHNENNNCQVLTLHLFTCESF